MASWAWLVRSTGSPGAGERSASRAASARARRYVMGLVDRDDGWRIPEDCGRSFEVRGLPAGVSRRPPWFSKVSMSQL